jgi:hypothetical protein
MNLSPTSERNRCAHYTLEADSPEESAAWDVLVEELQTVRQFLLDVWNEAAVVTA